MPFNITKRMILLICLGLVAIVLFSHNNQPITQTLPAKAHPENTQNVFFPILFNETLTATQPETWLTYVNQFRKASNLPLLNTNSDWEYGNQLHGRYSVKHDILIHDEDRNSPWHTPEGLAAAQNSNLAGTFDANATYRFAIDAWMQAPFHAVGILDPELHTTGYGDYREADGGLQMGAGIDVLRGLGTLPSDTSFPIFYPGAGQTIHLTFHWGETPSPLASCPGYAPISGLPLIIQVGAGEKQPVVASSMVEDKNGALEHCVFSETTYQYLDHKDAEWQDKEALGRAILDIRDAIVIIPKEPLQPGMRYTVTIIIDGIEYFWSFDVATNAATAESYSGTSILPFFAPQLSPAHLLESTSR